MRPADTWKDYELLDATGGNRLERWGETILIRHLRCRLPPPGERLCLKSRGLKR